MKLAIFTTDTIRQWIYVATPAFINQYVPRHKRDILDGLVQDCSISSALAMEILQSCTKPPR